MVIQEPERQSSYLALVGVKLGGSRLDLVDLEMALYKKTSVHCLVYVLDPVLKIDSVICSSHNTHVSCFAFGFRFFV